MHLEHGPHDVDDKLVHIVEKCFLSRVLPASLFHFAAVEQRHRAPQGGLPVCAATAGTRTRTFELSARPLVGQTIMVSCGCKKHMKTVK